MQTFIEHINDLVGTEEPNFQNDVEPLIQQPTAHEPRHGDCCTCLQKVQGAIDEVEGDKMKDKSLS